MFVKNKDGGEGEGNLIETGAYELSSCGKGECLLERGGGLIEDLR